MLSVLISAGFAWLIGRRRPAWWVMLLLSIPAGIAAAAIGAVIAGLIAGLQGEPWNMIVVRAISYAIAHAVWQPLIVFILSFWARRRAKVPTS